MRALKSSPTMRHGYLWARVTTNAEIIEAIRQQLPEAAFSLTRR